MPYLICVNRPGYMPESEPYAVATADEALSAACDEMRFRDMDPSLPFDAAAIRDHGTVIPLSDGYMIDVRRVSWPELAELCGYGTRDRWPAEPREDIRARLLDAYNAV